MEEFHNPDENDEKVVKPKNKKRRALLPGLDFRSSWEEFKDKQEAAEPRAEKSETWLDKFRKFARRLLPVEVSPLQEEDKPETDADSTIGERTPLNSPDYLGIDSEPMHPSTAEHNDKQTGKLDSQFVSEEVEKPDQMPDGIPSNPIDKQTSASEDNKIELPEELSPGFGQVETERVNSRDPLEYPSERVFIPAAEKSHQERENEYKLKRLEKRQRKLRREMRQTQKKENELAIGQEKLNKQNLEVIRDAKDKVYPSAVDTNSYESFIKAQSTANRQPIKHAVEELKIKTEEKQPEIIGEKEIKVGWTAEHSPAPKGTDLESADKATEILHKVETAAELNVPIEQTYEKRHEIKDEDTTIQTQYANSPDISTLIADRRLSAIHHLNSKLEKSSGTNAGKPPKSFEMKKEGDIYKKAVGAGFITAVVLIAIIVVLFYF